MSIINILDQDTINKIAAGEVVERPSSVVKELVENAIDAGATAVSVVIAGGGAELIRITDNGSGFDPEDIRVAFKKNTTSKIKCAEDLDTVLTLGFRGEALSSIAAVAHVELLTKKPGELMGVRYCISGGIEESYSDVGCPDGTTFIVKDLFYNTPVRKKFLKSAMTEAGYVNEVCERIALAHPEVSIKFSSNGKQILSTSGNGNLRECVYMIYGRGTAEQLLEVNYEAGDMRISGLVARPLIARGNRNYENYFLNGRYIKNPVVSKAIEEAYRTYMMQNRYPFTVLSLTLPASKYDVNVHPSKLEVRFEESQLIYEFVYKAVFDAVKHGETILESTVDDEDEKKDEKPAASKMPEPFEFTRKYDYNAAVKTAGLPVTNSEKPRAAVSDTVFTATMLKKGEKPEDSVFTTGSAVKPAENVHENTFYAAKPDFEELPKPRVIDLTGDSENSVTAGLQSSGNTYSNVSSLVNSGDTEETDDEKENNAEEVEANSSDSTAEGTETNYANEKSGKPANEQLSFLTPEAVKSHRIIGQLFETYWLVEYDEKLYIIDQHAAHERILYEKIVKEYKTGQVNSQLLYPAPVIELSLSEADKLNRVMDRLNALGYEIEPFGGREYRLLAVPEGLTPLGKKELLMEFIDGLTEDCISGSVESVMDRLATMSCKAAVKGNTKLSELEAKALIDQLLSLENPFHCPHGRPIEISFSKYEIEKKFKRIV